MGIFAKLRPAAKSGKATENPLVSEQNLRILLGQLDQSTPSRHLLAIQDWLGEIGTVERDFGAAIAQAALIQLEKAGHADVAVLVQQSLFSGKSSADSERDWAALESYAADLMAAYLPVLGELASQVQAEPDRNRLARDAVALFRIWALRNKLMHFHYRMPLAALWADAHSLLSMLTANHLEQVRVIPYSGESATTPLREYLVGAHFECVPGSNLVPQQLEVLDRFLRSNIELEMTADAEEQSTHCIDLSLPSGPRPVKNGAATGLTVQYFSTVKLHDQLVALADALSAGRHVPPWLSLIALDSEHKEAALRTVGKQWSIDPTHRLAKRQEEQWELRVVTGFESAYKMIAASHHVHTYSGQLFEERQRKASDGQDAADTAVQAFDMLLHIEETGSVPGVLSIEANSGKVSFETWHQVDGSATGFGASPPTILPHHLIGALVAVRPASSVDWRLGIIRRIGHDSANRPGIGVETLDDDAICAQANLIDPERVWVDGGVDGATSWSNILFLKTDDELLLPHASFAGGKMVSAIDGDRIWHVQLESLLDRGADYDRVRVRRV